MILWQNALNIGLLAGALFIVLIQWRLMNTFNTRLQKLIDELQKAKQ